MPTKKRYEHKITLGKDIDGNLFHHKLLINHNHRPCRWFALAPLGHDPG
jgi:hypothetical protein